MKNSTLTFIRRSQSKTGGAERYLERLIKALKSRGIKTEKPLIKIPKFLPSWIQALIFNYRICKNKRNIYFSLERISCPDIYRAGDGVHKAYMKIKGFSLNPLHAVYLFLERQTFKNAKHIIANSEMIKKQITEYYSVSPSKISVVYNGIPLTNEKIDKKDAKEKLSSLIPYKKSKKIILFVGSGFKRKGVSEFLYILSNLKEDYFGIIVGKEKHLEKYKNEAKELGIFESVFFTGPRHDVDIFYAAADIFLFPTHYEPFSNVVLEAMSYKNIVFTTKQNGASEILDEEFIMNNPGDTKITVQIDRLLKNEEELKKIQQYSYEKVQQFSIEKNVDETLKIINEVIN